MRGESQPGSINDPFLRETIENLLAQRLGDAARLLDPSGRAGLHTASTLHDLGLPAEFVRRAADRALRRSYEAQFPRMTGTIRPGAPPRSGDPSSVTPETRAGAGGGGRRLAVYGEESGQLRPAAARGFSASTESGEHQAALVRLQLPRGDHYLGAGDGGGVTIAQGLLAALPGAMFAAAVRRKHLAVLHGALEASVGAGAGGGGDIALLPMAGEVSQWAQDNGKAGTATADNGRRIRATLAPRAATRREAVSEAVPGDDSAVDAMERLGPSAHTVVRSSLLFQGGNLLVVRAPMGAGRRAGESMALLSESEVYRNKPALGSAERVLEAFRAELGVDRVEVLPAVSHHLDYEVSVRAVAHSDGAGWRVVAFVNDDLAAARRVIAAARSISGTERPQGQRLTKLSAGPHDPWAGNAALLGLAHDVLEAAESAPLRATPPPALGTPRRAYLDSLSRLLADRAALHARLRQLGFEVIPIPSLAMGGDGDGAAGLNAVNALQTRSTVLVPAHGGCFAEVDAAACGAYRGLLPPETGVVAVSTLESQRRNGALHCSASVYEALDTDKDR